MQTVIHKYMKGEKDISPAVANWLRNDLIGGCGVRYHTENGNVVIHVKISNLSSSIRIVGCHDIRRDKTCLIWKKSASLLSSQEYIKKERKAIAST